MKTLTIKDLSASKELDRKTMSAVRGGIMAGGCVVDPVRNPYTQLYELQDTFKSLGIDFPF